MILKPTFTNGRGPNGGKITVSSKIPPSELDRIRRIRSSLETIVALLNETEDLHSWRQKRALGWSVCPYCRAIFIGYRKQKRVYCSRECNGQVRGKEWGTYAHKARAAWSEDAEARWRKRMKGAGNPAWKGGVTYFKRKGRYANQSIKYVRCPEAFLPMARKDGYVMEHRLLVAMELGRPLLRSEVVHHRNHDATDNRIENLVLFASNADHKRHEHGQPIEPLWQPSSRSRTRD